MADIESLECEDDVVGDVSTTDYCTSSSSASSSASDDDDGELDEQQEEDGGEEVVDRRSFASRALGVLMGLRGSPPATPPARPSALSERFRALPLPPQPLRHELAWHLGRSTSGCNAREPCIVVGGDVGDMDWCGWMMGSEDTRRGGGYF